MNPFEHYKRTGERSYNDVAKASCVVISTADDYIRTDIGTHGSKFTAGYCVTSKNKQYEKSAKAETGLFDSIKEAELFSLGEIKSQIKLSPEAKGAIDERINALMQLQLFN